MIGFELLNKSGVSNGAIYWVYQYNGKLYCKELYHYSDGASSQNTNYYANIVYA